MVSKIIHLPKIQDPRGNLTFLQFPSQIPFEIQKISWVYDVPQGGKLDEYSNLNKEYLVIALNGNFDVVVREANGNRQRYFLKNCFEALYLPLMTLSSIENFSANAVVLILCSKSDFIDPPKIEIDE